MFSQFRHAVENLAISPRSSTDAQSDEHNNASLSSLVSAESPTSSISSGQLAESALSSLRKSFITNRPQASLTHSMSLPSVASPDKPRHKMNLEERLRASLSAADVSTTSAALNKSPPAESAIATETPLSPSSIPLPDSPVMASPLEIDQIPSSDPGEDDTEPHVPNNVQDDSENSISNHVDEAGAQIVASILPDPKSEVDHTTEAEGSSSSIIEPAVVADDVVESSPATQASTSMESEDSATGVLDKDDTTSNVDVLEERLRELEQRFADVSTSFKRLQAEKLAADKALRDLTPLSSIEDTNALKDYLQSLNSKTEASVSSPYDMLNHLICDIQVYQDEIKRLNGKLEGKISTYLEDRIEELRETHKLSSTSQVDQIDGLRNQLRKTDVLLEQAQKSMTTTEEKVSQKEKEIASLKSDVQRMKNLVKDEEEKRTKAISLLKSVRQKLVKAEKDKEDALKEAAMLREKDRAGGEKEQAERTRLLREIESINAEKEEVMANLRAQFENEITGLREQHNKEMAATKGQFELEAITTKSAHTKEISSKNSHINTLEGSLNSVTRDKNNFFEQLQLRQAETESAQSLLESIQHQNTELQYQLRQATDHIVLLKDNLNEVQREQDLRSREPGTSAENVAHLLAASEAKYEAKVSDLKRINAVLEKERNESEAEWSRKLKDRGAEIEELKRLLGSSAKNQEEEEEVLAELKTELGQKDEEIVSLEHRLGDLLKINSRLENVQISAQAVTNELQTKITVLEKQVEEDKTKEGQLRQTNKSLREELRKVQSSVALLERQRNPGVGYWTSRTSESSPSDKPTPTPSTPRISSPIPDGSASQANEEEVNLEYLRNVILQFLEHKEMRPNLVRVLSIILHFTPQETRRLMSKV
ncbi:hypothetical protein AGABI2DRAFT_239477 [Agaricus bisporus var. bisporus H97]|uniref:hypothetical protein n=1 Tax=Agaricus bisporus var. bisporus (strain H97 / ATCC MYA-4626 / FGSC 10389) TaxID=936046 RepID=UPI00029F60A7|nr:hypothetical protein AGABI2DRAFT_239477 [Agaricus bisporus var. bisporus H97]EKV52018.1 hypothetical protein AGABI2DRAFT_239477 [Agaricus bisporus var. bisporus H97]